MKKRKEVHGTTDKGSRASMLGHISHSAKTDSTKHLRHSQHRSAMLLRALNAVRPVVVAAAAKPSARTTALRSFASSSRRLSGDHHGPPQLYGPGSKNAEAIPSDAEQATGLERFQLLGRMEGVDVFDLKPLDASRLGTAAEPIKVQSFVRVFPLAPITYRYQVCK